MRSLFMKLLIGFLGFSTVAVAADWVKLNSSAVRCQYYPNTKSVAIFSSDNLLYVYPTESGFNPRGPLVLIGNCNRALEQAKREYKDVYVSSEGELIPEDGFFVRANRVTGNSGTKSKSEVDF